MLKILFSVELSAQSKEYYGILPYFGSPHYKYQVPPMGLTISPAKWMEYINLLLENIAYRSQYIAIIDGLLVHMDILEFLF